MARLARERSNFIISSLRKVREQTGCDISWDGQYLSGDRIYAPRDNTGSAEPTAREWMWDPACDGPTTRSHPASLPLNRTA